MTIVIVVVAGQIYPPVEVLAGQMQICPNKQNAMVLKVYTVYDTEMLFECTYFYLRRNYGSKSLHIHPTVHS